MSWNLPLGLQYTAISINVFGLNLQTYKSRPNGAMGIYYNLHITIEEIYKFVFLHVEYFETFLVSFLSPLCSLDFSF